MIWKSSTDDSHIRIRHNLDEQFFDYVEEILSSPNPDPGIAFLRDNHTTSVQELIDVTEFMKSLSQDRFGSYRLFNPKDYWIFKSRDGTFIVFRDNNRDMGHLASLRDACTLKYDPTNGLYSEGFHFRIFRR